MSERSAIRLQAEGPAGPCAYRYHTSWRFRLNWYRKRARALFGGLGKGAKPYDPTQFWDRHFAGAVGDRDTLEPGKNPQTTRYHYNSTENLILRHLVNNRFALEDARVLDIGSGGGHWIDFYRGLGAGACVGVDISEFAVASLRKRFEGCADVSFHHGDIADLTSDTIGKEPFDIVNAIGVLFHLVDDAQFRRAVDRLTDALRPGGLLIVGGAFGLIDELAVQGDAEAGINKLLRSRRTWKRILRPNYELVKIYRNRAHLFIDDTVPENHVLIAAKRAK